MDGVKGLLLAHRTKLDGAISTVRCWKEWKQEYPLVPKKYPLAPWSRISSILSVKPSINSKGLMSLDRMRECATTLEAAKDQPLPSRRFRRTGLPLPSKPLPESPYELKRLLRHIEQYLNKKDVFIGGSSSDSTHQGRMSFDSTARDWASYFSLDREIVLEIDPSILEVVIGSSNIPETLVRGASTNGDANSTRKDEFADYFRLYREILPYLDPITIELRQSSLQGDYLFGRQNELFLNPLASR